MKKVFISQDMRGKTIEEILTVRQKVEEAFKKEYSEQTFEFIQSFKPELAAETPLKALSQSLAMMEEADIVLAPSDRMTNYFMSEPVLAFESKTLRGVEAETMLANSYGKNVAFYRINDKGEVHFIYSVRNLTWWM